MKNSENKRNVILSESEINDLFDFVKSKSVRYIDVTHEIVDHLASAIEDQMNNDDKLNFDQALRIVYSDFPITGFYYFVQEKEKAINKYWFQVIKNYALSYLKPLKLLTVIIMFMTIFGSITLIGKAACVVIFAVAFIYHIYSLYFNYQFFKKNDLKKEEYLITASYCTKFINNFFAPGFLFIVLNSDYFSRLNPLITWQVVSLTVIIIVSILWTYGTIYYFPKVLVNDVKTKYHHIEDLNNKLIY